MKIDTIAVTAGRDPSVQGGAVSPAVDRASTRIFPDMQSIDAARKSGKLSAFMGSSTPDHAAAAIAALEGMGCDAFITSSGMSALTITFLTVLGQGDHVLLPDSVFGPTRAVAEGLLARMGISASYYHPCADERTFSAAFQPNTRLVLTESPGSNTFEVQDISMIVRVAHAAGAIVAIDNSWATPIMFRPLEHGVDISISAATKYLIGHSDAILGTVAASPALIQRLRETARQMGDTPGADDAWLLSRGLRTLPIRLRHHDNSTRQIIAEISGWPGVRRILHPMVPGAPGHEFWTRDFDGGSGLFGLLMDPLTSDQMERFLKAFRVFSLGFSWGGFESLILPIAQDPARRIAPMPDGTLLRIHVGLEDTADLIDDLRAAFSAID